MNLELLLAAALVSGTPVLFAALGELLTERAGILNLGVEGIMLVGALAGFAATASSGGFEWGILAALLVGAMAGLIYAFLVITLRLDQIVTGLAFTILGAGVSAFFGKALIGQPPGDTVPRPDFGALTDLPLLGVAFFRQDILVYIAIVLTISVAIFIRWSHQGLLLRALGENPEMLDALGINVLRLRYLYVALGGALMGMGGAYISLAFTPSWIENMTAGRGWIAIALVIFATWRPGWLLVGAVLFGAVDALRFRLQISGGIVIDPHFLNMLPYLTTIGILIIVSRSSARQRLGAPAALGVAYDRERR
ncbi:MAG: ABC transporter permease [Pseudomonadota bacterium]